MRPIYPTKKGISARITYQTTPSPRRHTLLSKIRIPKRLRLLFGKRQSCCSAIFTLVKSAWVSALPLFPRTVRYVHTRLRRYSNSPVGTMSKNRRQMATKGRPVVRPLKVYI